MFGPSFALIEGMTPLHRCAVTALFLTLACGPDSNQGEAGGEVSRSWNPVAVTQIESIPIAEVRTELKRLLDSKPKFATAEQREHAERLYTSYEMSPLWMDKDGLIDSRSRALVDALVAEVLR